MQTPQPRVAPKIGGELLELLRLNGAPSLLQPVRAGGDPNLSGDVVHAIYCTPIQYFPRALAIV